MTDAIITDNERINIEPKDVMVKGSNKKQEALTLKLLLNIDREQGYMAGIIR
ncbi:hypothetical protein ACLB1Q_35065 [Escherichia coli]